MSRRAVLHLDQFWDVHRFVLPFGHGKRIGRIHASTRAEAEAIAREQFGAEIDVTMACRDKRRGVMAWVYQHGHRRKA